MDIQKARLTAEAASVELAVASRNQQIRSAIAAGISLREIEAATGVPRSTAQRIGAAAPLTESEYTRLANAEVVARSEVIALEAVADTMTETETDSTSEA